jgi:MFS family permease
VLGEAFNVLFKDLWKFLLLALVALLPSALLMLVVGAATTGLAASPNVESASLGILLIDVPLGILCYALSQAATLYGAFQDMRGRPFGLGAAFGVAFSRFFPVLGVTICFGFAIVLGSILLVVPGMIVLAACYVALPACVMESLGPFESLSRSSALTKGHRWKVFGIFVVIIVISMVVGGLLQLVTVAIGGVVAGMVVSFVWNALYAAYNSVAIAVMYHDLRVLKEGIDIDRIAAVFD